MYDFIMNNIAMIGIVIQVVIAMLFIVLVYSLLPVYKHNVRTFLRSSNRIVKTWTTPMPYSSIKKQLYKNKIYWALFNKRSPRRTTIPIIHRASTSSVVYMECRYDIMSTQFSDKDHSDVPAFIR
jgi:hypothetical protein